MSRRSPIIRLLVTVALTAGLPSVVIGQPQSTSTTIQIEAGDVLQVTAFETHTDLWPDNFVTLPAQTIDCAGVFAVPHAGEVRAAGRTLTHIAREIEQRLATRAIEPRIVVHLLAKNTAGCAL